MRPPLPTQPPELIKKLAPAHARNKGKFDGEGRELFEVHLAPRHAEWLRRISKVEGRSVENMLERLVRIGYAADPYKGNQPPTDGQSFSGKAADLKAG